MSAFSVVRLCLLLVLLFLQIHSWDPIRRTQRHRLTLTSIHKSSREFRPDISPTASDLSTSNNIQHIQREDPQVIWTARLDKRNSQHQNQDVLPEAGRVPRRRRHANSSGRKSFGQLKRVRCVLGTCQVQNLSHRLYQLMGQSGRDESSPINPHSPHSYG